MKHITRILLGGICSAGIAVSAADSSTLFEFDSEPELKPVVSKQKDSKDALKEYLLPITPTEGRSFALECDLELKTFNHYAAVLIGLSNGKQQKLLMKFTGRRPAPPVRLYRSGSGRDLFPDQAIRQG